MRTNCARLSVCARGVGGGSGAGGEGGLSTGRARVCVCAWPAQSGTMATRTRSESPAAAAHAAPTDAFAGREQRGGCEKQARRASSHDTCCAWQVLAGRPRGERATKDLFCQGFRCICRGIFRGMPGHVPRRSGARRSVPGHAGARSKAFRGMPRRSGACRGNVPRLPGHGR